MDSEDLINSTIDDDSAVFALPLPDDDLLSLLKKPLQESQNYWDSTFKLKQVRQDNMDLWLPNHWKNKDVYDYQEEYLYQDPRVFTSVETICSIVNARTPNPEVMPGQDSVNSTQLAKDVQKALFAWAEKYRTADLFRIGTRNLLLKRVGYLKLRWDASVGQHGEIVPEHVSPEDIVVDSDAQWNEVPRFIAQKLPPKTGEELIALFPDAKQKIYEMLGVNRKNGNGDLIAYRSQLGKKKRIWEVWFRYYNEDTKQYSGGLAFVDENCQNVLIKDKNPNWNYKEESKNAVSNLLDFPAPPFFPINYLNDGTSYIDLTSMVEQAAPLQRILDRRGFQIMENAEMAGSGLIFNTLMIKKEDIARLTGSPDERIGVKGNVNEAVSRVAPPPLPNYVIEDKNDARSEIDNIFATHDISRGEQSANKTLGQDQLQQNQDYTRMDDIARAVERTASNFYRYVVQMMKVYYTEDHWFKATGEDGQYDFIVIKSDSIEDGVDINVEAGSTMPVNKKAQLDSVQTLAQMGMIDPLSIYEVISGSPLPSPKKMLERYIAFKSDPAGFAGSAKDEEFDRYAFMDIQILKAGKMPKPREDINESYLKFMNEFMVGGEFMNSDEWTPEKKQMLAQWMQQCQEQAQAQLEALQTQLPTPQDMQGANQQAVQQAQTEQALMGGGNPQQSSPGAMGSSPDTGIDPAQIAQQLANPNGISSGN